MVSNVYELDRASSFSDTVLMRYGHCACSQCNDSPVSPSTIRSYLPCLARFFPPPQPALSWTGLSRNEMRSFMDGAEVAPADNSAALPASWVKCTHQTQEEARLSANILVPWLSSQSAVGPNANMENKAPLLQSLMCSTCESHVQPQSDRGVGQGESWKNQQTDGQDTGEDQDLWHLSHVLRVCKALKACITLPGWLCSALLDSLPYCPSP